ncbi:MAG: toxin-antitoxin system antitoxin subunit [Paludibacter sp.]|nr:toxin-antitoxin system antitoxin subunit [Paludibacter sp.]
MKSSESDDRLKEAVQLCTIHVERMSFAYKKIEKHFPLTELQYFNIVPEELSYFDQLIFRFSKLQDCMGGKLFPALLQNLGEEISGMPFIDLLSKLEELNLLDNARDWLLLRETRNIVTHEYPFITKEVIDGLNLLSKHYTLILSIWKQIDEYIVRRFSMQ